MPAVRACGAARQRAGREQGGGQDGPQRSHVTVMHPMPRYQVAMLVANQGFEMSILTAKQQIGSREQHAW